MLNTLKYVALSLIRDKGIIIWALAFPLVLSTCFMFMFAGLDDMGNLEPIPVVVVEDENWESAPAFRSFMEAIGEDGASGEDAVGAAADAGTGADADVGTDAEVDAGADSILLRVQKAKTPQAAEELIQNFPSSENAPIGYITVNADGLPEVHVKGISSENSMDEASVDVLVMTMDSYASKRELFTQLVAENPQALTNPELISSIFELEDLTDRVSVTKNAPKESVRYFFALLGMAALFGANPGLIAILRLLPNIGPLGARREVGATSHVRALAGTILASWFVSFLCLLVAYAYIRVIAGVDFAGRDGACILAIAVSSLMATSLGACLGSLPKVNNSIKTGILTAFVCICALFAGLYGQPTMQLADSIAQSAPWAVVINPAAQISEAFFSLMYYDTLAPLMGHIAILLAMTVILFAISSIFLRRQRYASL